MNEKANLQKMLDSVGAMAEMSWFFYKAMLDSGADEEIAKLGMISFINGLLANKGTE